MENITADFYEIIAFFLTEEGDDYHTKYPESEWGCLLDGTPEWCDMVQKLRGYKCDTLDEKYNHFRKQNKSPHSLEFKFWDFYSLAWFRTQDDAVNFIETYNHDLREGRISRLMVVPRKYGHKDNFWFSCKSYLRYEYDKENGYTQTGDLFVGFENMSF